MSDLEAALKAATTLFKKRQPLKKALHRPKIYRASSTSLAMFLTFFRDHESHNEIDPDSQSAAEYGRYENYPDNDGVDIEILSQATANPPYLAVFTAAIELLGHNSLP
jgi:hypothetical protein